jgi:Kef-type K+ transport system membrane component KefB
MIIPGVKNYDRDLSHLIIQIVVILGTCLALSIVGHYYNQPSVIFEILGGIILGPSALGKNADYKELLFSASSIHNLKLVSNIGLELYLFIVGLEFNLKYVKVNVVQSTGIAIASMAVPFCLGIAISGIIFDTLQKNDNVNKTTFFVFIGTAMSITAFPVLARILKEGDMLKTKIGTITMGAAAINDAVSWVLLILAVSLSNSTGSASAAYVFIAVAFYTAIMFTVGKKLLFHIVTYIETEENFSSKQQYLNVNKYLFTVTIIFLFFSAWITSSFGVDSIIGSFIFGIIVPRNTKLFDNCIEKIEDIVITLFLPLYFAASGLRTDFTVINSKAAFGIVVLVCVIASIGKILGSGLSSYFFGYSVLESSAIAVLMNTRGLIELIVLNIGLEAKILSKVTFSVMVIMCLFTTFLTCPLLNVIYPKHLRIQIVGGLVTDSSAQLVFAEQASLEHKAGDGSNSSDGCNNENEQQVGINMQSIIPTSKSYQTVEKNEFDINDINNNACQINYDDETNANDDKSSTDENNFSILV